MRDFLISSSGLILLVILLRYLFRNKISRRMQYALWLVVLVRLCVPVQFGELSFSTSAIAETVEQAVVPQESTSYESAYEQPEVKVEPFDVDGYTHTYEAVEGWQFPDGYVISEERHNLEMYMYDIYACIVFGLGLWFILSNLSFRRKATKNLEALPVTDCPVPVYISQGVTSPCLIGLLRQKILLPPAATQEPEGLKHIIAHELTHRRHGDVFWGCVRCVLLCLYWVHPLVWWAAILSKKDCELACDEGAISKLGEEERIPYGQTLLQMVSVSSVSRGVGRVATTMAESKKQLTQRICCIAKKRNFCFAAVIAVLCLVAVMIPVAFAGKEPDPGEAYVSFLEDDWQRKLEREELPELQEQEGSIYEAYQKALTQTEGVVEYTLLDLNDDIVPELALRRSNLFTLDYGFYTYADGKAVPLRYGLPGYPEMSEYYGFYLDYTASILKDDRGRFYIHVGYNSAFALRLQQGEVMTELVDFPESYQSLPKAATFDFSLLDEVLLGRENRITFDLPEVKLEIPENWVEVRRNELDEHVSSISSPEYDVTTDGESLGITDGGGKYIPNVLRLEDGRLEGWSGGSSGGGVRYRADSGEITALLNLAFISYYVADGRIFVLAGTKTVDGLGAFYEIYKEDGEYKAKLIYRLNYSPLAVATVEDYCFVVTNFEIYVFHGDKIERITGNKGYSYFDCYGWYGENMIYANGCLYVGKTGHVMAFDINEESFTWYVPKEG